LKSQLIRFAVLLAAVAVAAAILGALVGRAVRNAQIADGYHAISRVPAGPESDLAVIDALRKAGSNLSRPTEIVYVVYVPAESDARQLAALLKKHNLRATVERPAEVGLAETIANAVNGSSGDSWAVFTVTKDVPSLANVRTARALFEDLARRYHGEYDGWEAAVQK
jgi:hypothetical protein